MTASTTIEDIPILVNSCDAFEDCWHPFFTLLQRFWPESARHPIYLNTEFKDFNRHPFNITASKAQFNTGKKPTWSQQLGVCLELISSDYLIYLQEDYFINHMVDIDFLRSAFHYLQESDVQCINLTTFGNKSNYKNIASPIFGQVRKHDRYLVSLQASMWRKSAISSLLREHENAWQFEVFGSLRARKCDFRILTPLREHEEKTIRYGKTGIIKGKWFRPAVESLFAENGISIDFSRRGFHSQCNPWHDRFRVAKKLLSCPGQIVKSLT